MSSDWQRSLKRELFEQFARVGKALASGARLELLDLLSQAERRVEALADLAGLSVANASQHLQVLRRARMVEVRREGLYASYRLADERVLRLWQAVRAVGEARLAEIHEVVAAYLKDRARWEPVRMQELARRLREGTVTVIDVRPREEYAAGHIPGAVSIPVRELPRRWVELPRSREIVAYCRGPFCVQSDAAVALLQRNGFKARRLEAGLPDWRTAGLRVEREAMETPGPARPRDAARPSRGVRVGIRGETSRRAGRRARRAGP